MSASALLAGRRRRALAAAAALAVVGLGATACSSSGGDAAASGATVVDITLTDGGCSPEPASVAAGPITFKVKNDGSGSVTEGELVKGDVILGEKENLTPGLSGSFSLTVDAGDYAISCPNAEQDSWPFTVTGATAKAAKRADAAELKAATAQYRQYVLDEVALLTAATTKFTDAVRAGDVDEAKAQFAAAREHYESIEPVAESFGDLDPRIDLREADVEKGDEWTGFHRIEKALWVGDTTKGMTPIANQLDEDIAELKTKVADTTYQPAQLANGATGLLDEIASSKITGEEDIFSHTDLSDFQANLDGSRKAFVLLTPALFKTNPQLAETITKRFAAAQKALDAHKEGDGFVDYSTVTQAQRRVLSQKIDALAEPLSTVAGKIA